VNVVSVRVCVHVCEFLYITKIIQHLSKLKNFEVLPEI